MKRGLFAVAGFVLAVSLANPSAARAENSDDDKGAVSVDVSIVSESNVGSTSKLAPKIQSDGGLALGIEYGNGRYVGPSGFDANNRTRFGIVGWSLGADMRGSGEGTSLFV